MQVIMGKESFSACRIAKDLRAALTGQAEGGQIDTLYKACKVAGFTLNELYDAIDLGKRNGWFVQSYDRIYVPLGQGVSG